MSKDALPLARVEAFTSKLGIRLPILLAPMAGACSPSLSIAVANAGGMGACGALLMAPDAIAAWADEFRQGSGGAFQINLWIPDPPPARDAEAEAHVREFLAAWGPVVSAEMGDAKPPDFDAQCEAVLAARPRAISSIMGLYPPAFVDEMKRRGILWFATATTVAEARLAEDAGADAVIAQGMEAGGHRGAFRAEDAETQLVGLFALLPQISDSVSVPVIATGGIADGRGVAAALILGASAAMIGTGFLRSPEAKMPPPYADRLNRTEAHDTRLTRAFSGRPGRSARTRYVEASASPDAPTPAPYPVQRGLTRPMREEATKAGDPERMQMWAGQAARLAKAEPAAAITESLWEQARRLLR
ncbi:MAG TPA: nitronate monooxygenase [Terracidiphilus sp.]|jgi:nitronate monooxygenase